MLDNQPNLTDLHTLITKVPSYPISAGQMVELAAKEHADRSVVEFYQSFPPDEVFSSEDDLIARTEHIEIMNREDQPQEVLLSPEED